MWETFILIQSLKAFIIFFRDGNVEKNQIVGDAVNNSGNRSGVLASSLNNSNMKTPEYSKNSSQSSSFQTGSNSSLHNKKGNKKVCCSEMF